ncbi:MAG TPA: hypothetical protein VHS06_03000 [Chloroflexota bacterium]|nr:hypothetical protein [Chloroflexota bacterium]
MDAEEMQTPQQGESRPEPSSDSSAWSEEAKGWYEELKTQEDDLAPWLSVEWTGEEMKVNRG